MWQLIKNNSNKKRKEKSSDNILIPTPNPQLVSFFKISAPHNRNNYTSQTKATLLITCHAYTHPVRANRTYSFNSSSKMRTNVTHDPLITMTQQVIQRGWHKWIKWVSPVCSSQSAHRYTTRCISMVCSLPRGTPLYSSVPHHMQGGTHWSQRYFIPALTF